MKPELFTICPIINTCFFWCIKASKPFNELLNDALRTSEVILTFEERYKDIGCLQGVISNCFWEGALRKSPRKSSRWDLFPEPDCVTSIRWAQLWVTFSTWKKNVARKPEIFYITFGRYNLNQARTETKKRFIIVKNKTAYKFWTLPVLPGSGSVLGSGPECQTRARADL
jgi:hypothetical protein